MTKDQQIRQLTLDLETQKRKYDDEIDAAKQLTIAAIRVRELAQLLLQALSLRLLTTFVLLADCVMFAVAISIGSWQAILGAVLFAIAAWSVLFVKPKERNVDAQ